MSEQIQTGLKKGRGRAQKSVDLIEAMHDIAEECQPITGRGVGYKLFTLGLIESMSKNEMQKVYRLLREAREEETIPWEWIVDETRELESVASWRDPKQFLRDAKHSYRRDFWRDQPRRVEVWSEKGTIRGVLGPVLNEYGVGFRVLHGFNSATGVNDIANNSGNRLLEALYVGDFDPSGLFMSKEDLPRRIDQYGGDHVLLRRIAILKPDLGVLPTFPASDKKKDPRYKWFIEHHGDLCCELDAMDPNDLRDRVEAAIENIIDHDAWERCAKNEKAEQESLSAYFDAWRRP
jgi:hypothetical protein